MMRQIWLNYSQKNYGIYDFFAAQNKADGGIAGWNWRKTRQRLPRNVSLVTPA